MNASLAVVVGLMVSSPVVAESLVEGWVRQSSGEPVEAAQIWVFDWTDLQRGAVAQATTDATGYFALPLALLGSSVLPQAWTLGQNYPNPFNPSTIIPYQLAAAAPVRLEVFNLLGQRIAMLVDGERPAGFHTATWHATDAAGRAVGAGVYIYRMTVSAERQTGRMVLLDGQAGVSAGGTASVWSGASGGSRSDGEQVYGLIVSGEGLAPYVDSSFRVEAGMAPVELVVQAGQHLAGKATDDDCAFCDLFDVLNDDDEGPSPSGKAQTTLEVPAVPTNLRFEAVTDSSCRVRWDAAEGATDYDVNYKRAVGGKWTNEPHKGVRLYNTIYDLEPNTEYRWAARAENSDGTSEWVFGPNFTTVGADGQVTIPDANLRAAIAEALGKARGATITVAEMKTLAGLDADYSGIRDLTGLEFATNLTELSLFGNDISDISALRGLTHLTELSLGLNDISDISALRGLTKLTDLWLSNNDISDISALSGLTNLTDLSLGLNDISDVSALRGLTKLKWLFLGFSDISDISALSGLPNLTYLWLRNNDISDISALSGLPNLTELNLRQNPLSASSINDHIPALRRSGATVRFDPLLRESDFDIELVFLDDHFDEENKNEIQYAARRWMSIIREDLPDFTFTDGWSGSCGDRSYAIPSGERIDDLRIYVVSFNGDDAGAPAGWAGPDVLRETSHLSVVGCMGFNLVYNVSPSTALHEIGHVLGIGTQPWSKNGFVRDSSNDPHFNGPRAIAAFNDAGGRNYTGKKVPLEENGGHWRESVLSGELMEPSSGSGWEGVVSAITIQALADVGYGVDVTQADPYTLPSAAAKVVATGSTPDDHLPGRLAPQWTCGVDTEHKPIHMVDPQGRIVRTLHR